jgi:hypothetical protein
MGHGDRLIINILQHIYSRNEHQCDVFWLMQNLFLTFFVGKTGQSVKLHAFLLLSLSFVY